MNELNVITTNTGHTVNQTC